MLKHVFGCVLAAALALGSAALASTVSIDFVDGVTKNVGSRPVTYYYPGGSYTTSAVTGVWQEEGTNTYFRMHSDLIADYGEPVSSIKPPVFQNLSDSDPGADPFVTERLVVTRIDNGKFNLKGIGSGGSYQGLGVLSEFRPEGGTSADTVAFYPTLLGPTLEVTGRKVDGSIVQTMGTVNAISNWIGPSDWPYAFGPTDVQFTPGALSMFENLTELTLKVGFIDGVTERLSAIKTMLEFGAPPILLEGIDRCGFRSCTVDGVGEWIFGIDLFGGRNDIINVGIDRIDLEFVGGPGSHPAPVPLPASALLFVGALGMLSVTRLRQRKSA